MNILIISPTPFVPVTAGNRARISSLVSHLKGQGHLVTFLLLDRERVDSASVQKMADLCDAFYFAEHDRKLELLGSRGENKIDDWYLESDDAAVRGLLTVCEQPDMVIVEYVFLSAALRYFPDPTIKVIDTHDIFANRSLELAKIGVDSKFFSTSVVEENRGLLRANLILAITDKERLQLEARVNRPILTLGYWPEERTENQNLGATHFDAKIGWIGSSNALNILSLQKLISCISNEAFEKAGTRFAIAGGACSRISSHPTWVDLHGEVKSSFAFLNKLEIFINPHIGGTGLKIKTIESLAAGCPVIGTADAFEGLPAVEPWHLAPDPATCGAYLQQWLSDMDFRLKVQQSSELVARRYLSMYNAQLQAFSSLQELRTRLSYSRILLVTDVPFWQENLGNHARISALVSAMRQHTFVDILFVPDGRNPQAYTDHARKAPFGIIIVEQLSSHTASPPPAGLTNFEMRSFRNDIFKAVENQLKLRPYDVMMLEYIRLSYIRKVKGAPKITAIDTHDLMSLRARNFSVFGKRHFIEISAIEEAEILSSVSLAMCIQPVEAHVARSWLSGRTLCVPHPAPQTSDPNPTINPKKIVFVGGNSPMNRDGLKWMLDQIWPIFDQKAELHVAGLVCDQINTNYKSVFLHGVVKDLDTFLSDAAVGVNPVYYGGGLKIKTLDFLARGLPCVLTAEACYGLPEHTEPCWLMATSRAEFVGMLMYFLNNPSEREKFKIRSLRYVKQNFGRNHLENSIRTISSLASPQKFIRGLSQCQES